MSEALKPCPFCGGMNIKEIALDSSDAYGFRDVFGCVDCDYGFTPDWGPDLKAWNTRADLPATDEQAFANPKVQALVEAAKRVVGGKTFGAAHPNHADLALALAAMEEKP